MPASKILISLLLFMLPVVVFSQDITGLWRGQLFNDSTGQYYSYEIGISEEKGKLSGFSHTWFILDDKQYFGVKKVKVRRAKDGKIIVEDDGLISHNYPVPPAKGIRQLNILTLEISDSIMRLTGPFTTNRTRDYAPLTGTVTLERKNDYWQSALIPHLEELKVDKLSFVKNDLPLKEVPVSNSASDADMVSDNVEVAKKPVAETTSSQPDNADTSTKKLIVVNTVHEKKPGSIVKEKNEVKKPQLSSVAQAVSIGAPELNDAPAANVSSRTTILQQTVFFSADSLQLSLYDNGEVDGDTVSVLMNGMVIMAKERLSTNAVRKSIFIGPDSDSVMLVMYAENLGAIAPNTGLLVIRDGTSIYEVRFSGDLAKNAAVMLRRKK